MLFLTLNILFCTVYLCWPWLHCSLLVAQDQCFLTVNIFFLHCIFVLDVAVFQFVGLSISVLFLTINYLCFIHY